MPIWHALKVLLLQANNTVDRYPFPCQAIRSSRPTGQVERVPAQLGLSRTISPDRRLVYDRSLVGEGPNIRIVSRLSLGRQIGAEGATWLDREFLSPALRSSDGFSSSPAAFPCWMTVSSPSSWLGAGARQADGSPACAAMVESDGISAGKEDRVVT